MSPAEFSNLEVEKSMFNNMLLLFLAHFDACNDDGLI
jgi:hypothetical protein